MGAQFSIKKEHRIQVIENFLERSLTKSPLAKYVAAAFTMCLPTNSAYASYIKTVEMSSDDYEYFKCFKACLDAACKDACKPIAPVAQEAQNMSPAVQALILTSVVVLFAITSPYMSKNYDDFMKRFFVKPIKTLDDDLYGEETDDK